jgi:hypothetical protein
MMRSGGLAAALLVSCARVSSPDPLPDAGSAFPIVEDVEPQPGAVEPEARFTVRFSAAMDEGQLLAASGRSESVVLATEADAERAAGAIEHAPLSAHERALLVPAGAQVASDRRSIALAPDAPLEPGGYVLLVSPRLKDESGRKLAGNGMRFAYRVAAAPATASLVTPPPGGEVPWNLNVVRAVAAAGRVALLGPGGKELASADGHGPVALALPVPLVPGAEYTLALDGKPLPAQAFTAAACARSAAPALQGATAQVTPRDTSVVVQVVLDWPASVEVQVTNAAGAMVSAELEIRCAPPPCGPQSFVCPGAVRIEGLSPAADYPVRVVARDDFGFVLTGSPQQFSTVAVLPRLIVSEVMASGIEGEYVEVLNVGPGAADLESAALQGGDGIVRPLLGGSAPLPLILPPGARALAAGASFDPGLYPTLPPGTPVLRASTQRLLGRGLADDAPAPFALVTLSQVPVELDRFPAPALRCGSGVSLQRDEAVPPDVPAPWTCGRAGGTAGRPP